MKLRLAFLLALAFASTAQAILWIVPSRFSAAGTTQVASDNFTYSNNTELSTTGNWAAITGTIQAYGSQADSAGATGNLYRQVGTYNANQYSTATLNGTTQGVWGVAVRVQGTADGYVLYFNSYTNELQLDRINSGTSTTINSVAFTFVSGMKLWIEASGTGSSTRITAKKDVGAGWVTLWSSVDPGGTYIDGGKAGIWSYNTWGTMFLDDWSGGNL